MLNKLLKRCLPWMDKGRWYHIGVTGNNIIYDDIFSHHEIVDGHLYVYFKPDFKGNIVDIKTTFDRANITDPADYVLFPDDFGSLQRRPGGNCIFGWGPRGDESYDIWLFIRPIHIVEG